MKLDDILNQVKAVEEEKIKNENTSFVDPRILVFKQGGTYKGRLLPNPKDIPNTFVTYEDVGFTSRNGSGEYVFLGRSPSNAGIAPKNDQIKKVQWDAYKKAKENGDKKTMDEACKLIPNRKQLVNFYLESVKGDDKAKEKVGTAIALRFPARLDKEKKPSSEIYKTIHEGIFGEKANKIGTRAFDLSPKGRSLEIIVTEKGGWNDYSASFDDAEDLGLSKDKIEEILNSTHNLTEFVPAVKSEEDAKQLLDEHWFVKNVSSEDDINDGDSVPPSDDDNVDLTPHGKDESIDDILKDM